MTAASALPAQPDKVFIDPLMFDALSLFQLKNTSKIDVMSFTFDLGFIFTSILHLSVQHDTARALQHAFKTIFGLCVICACQKNQPIQW